MEWREHNEAALNEAERNFLEASHGLKLREEAEEKARQQRELAQVQALAEEQTRRADEQAQAATRLRRQRMGIIAVAVCAVILGGFAWIKQRQAQQHARIALSRELASAALHNSGSELGVLLAVQAVSTTKAPDGVVTEEASEALRTIVSPDAVKLEPPGHEGPVNSVAFNHDGTRLATASDDGTTKIWDASSGEELASLRSAEQNGGHLGITFSIDGEIIASGSSLTLVWQSECLAIWS